MNFKEFWRLYFTFNRSERRAIRFLLVVITIIILFNAFMPLLIQPKKWDYTPYQALFDSMSQSVSYKDSGFYSFQNKRDYNFSDSFRNIYTQKKKKIKPFNPNVLDEDGWEQLGLSEKQAKAVVSIRDRMGGFKNAEDVKKVKFIPEYVIQNIEPYMVFSLDTSQVIIKDSRTPVTLKTIKKLDINSADVNEWKELPGIGDKLAERIINFREKLGGFHYITQVCEVYGMPLETCEKITPHLSIVQKDIVKIHLNYSSTQELAKHPYISFKLASAIVSNRNAHGFYKSVEEILTLGLVERELYDKLAPYLTVQ